MLVSAFTRSLKDPFPPARGAGIGALGSTHSYYTPQDIATRILPALCHMTIDNEQSIRDQVSGVCVSNYDLVMTSLLPHYELIMMLCLL